MHSFYLSKQLLFYNRFYVLYCEAHWNKRRTSPVDIAPQILTGCGYLKSMKQWALNLYSMIVQFFNWIVEMNTSWYFTFLEWVCLGTLLLAGLAEIKCHFDGDVNNLEPCFSLNLIPTNLFIFTIITEFCKSLD